MTRLELLRRHALSHVRTARRLDRLYPSDSALLVALDSEATLAGAIMAAGKIDRDALDRLLGPVTEGEAPPANDNDLQTIRMVAKHG
jgi:hypothetical protein